MSRYAAALFVLFLVIAATAVAAFAEQPRMKRAPVATADTMNGYAFEDYKDFWKRPDWHFVTVRYRKDTGEMRLTYANDIAWKALLAGGKEYPDGAVFGKIGLMTSEDPAFTSSAVPAGARRYQLMVRDKARWQDIEGGWGYALFDGNGKAIAEDQDIAARACDACHALVPEKGAVFSEPFHLDVGAMQATPVSQPVSRIEFATVKTETLPPEVKNRLPTVFNEARVVQGKLAENLFRGTIDEIRPTLVKETLKSRKPALLMSKDGTLFSAVYADTEEKSCTVPGGKKGTPIAGFFTTGVLPGKKSEIAEHRHCEEK